jgi:hypothetical protein
MAVVLPPDPAERLEEVPDHHPREAGDSLAAAIVDRNVFHPDRVPVTAEEEMEPTPVQPTGPPPAPRDLRLVGIVHGSPAMAVVVGLVEPGVPLVVREGELHGGLRVRRITEHEVKLVGIDTLWVLRLEEPWR